MAGSLETIKKIKNPGLDEKLLGESSRLVKLSRSFSTKASLTADAAAKTSIALNPLVLGTLAGVHRDRFY